MQLASKANFCTVMCLLTANYLLCFQQNKCTYLIISFNTQIITSEFLSEVLQNRINLKRNKLKMVCFSKQAQVYGSRATLTSKKSLSQHTPSEKSDYENNLTQDESIKDCNGRIIPRLLIRAPTMDEVSRSFLHHCCLFHPQCFIYIYSKDV